MVAMAFGPPNSSSKDLYYMTWASPPGLYRIRYTGNENRSPVAVATASPTNGDLPLTTNFDGTQSSDPDNQSLSFDWDFGDGSAHATTATASHEYQAPGTYTATLTVSDGQGGQDTAEIRIDAGNNAPIPSIASPTANQQFRVGETITLSGSGTDPEDLTVPSSQLTWQVVKHHATHTHPFLPPTTGDSATITAPVPEDLGATTNSYLEVRLTATDSQGLSTTVSQELRPRLVNLSFATNPAGLRIDLNGTVAPASTHRVGWVDAAAQHAQDAVHLQWSGTELRLVVGRRCPVARDHDSNHRHDVHGHVHAKLRTSQGRPENASTACSGLRTLHCAEHDAWRSTLAPFVYTGCAGIRLRHPGHSGCQRPIGAIDRVRAVPLAARQ